MRALNGAWAANAALPRTVMQYIRVVIAKSYLVVDGCAGWRHQYASSCGNGRQGETHGQIRMHPCRTQLVNRALPAIYANEAAAAATVLANADSRLLRGVSRIDFEISRYHTRHVSDVMASRESRSHRATVASLPPTHAIDRLVR